jgi:hypothetical protein
MLKKVYKINNYRWIEICLNRKSGEPIEGFNNVDSY